MTHDSDTSDDVRELRDLATSMAPPAALEDRVVATLYKRGLLRSSGLMARIGAARISLAAAACVTLLGMGIVLGRATAPPAVPGSLTGAETDLYALLLFETDGYDRPSGAVAAARYGEYSEWVARASATKQFVTGEDLEVRRGWLLAPTEGGVEVTEASAVAGNTPLSGLFFVRAASPEEALALARDLPHLKHGGSVVVQKTLRTDVAPDAAP